MMVDIVLFPTVHDMGGLMWSCDDLKSCTVDPDFCCGQTHKSTKMLKKSHHRPSLTSIWGVAALLKRAPGKTVGL